LFQLQKYSKRVNAMAKAATMFTWQGKDRQGQSRKGEISATSLSEAKNLLRRQGISANKVKKLSTPLFGRGGQKIVAADISVISRQIATMLAAGVTLIQSLDMIAQGHAKAVNANNRRSEKW
jgi:type IV pilus assembly protein PilC